MGEIQNVLALFSAHYLLSDSPTFPHNNIPSSEKGNKKGVPSSLWDKQSFNKRNKDHHVNL